jgi:hypothetical protein
MVSITDQTLIAEFAPKLVTEVSGPYLRAGIFQAYKIDLNFPRAEKCCLCEAFPTVMFELLDREKVLFMRFRVCIDCIKVHRLEPE